MPPTRFCSTDGNHEPTPRPQGCWWCKRAPHMDPPPLPRGHRGAWLRSKASCWSSRRVLGPLLLGTMARPGPAVAGLNSQDPREAPVGRKCLHRAAAPSLPPTAARGPRGAVLLPALPKRHRLVPAAGSPAPRRVRGGQAPARQPSSPLPRPAAKRRVAASGEEAGGGGGVAHAAPLHPSTCTSLPRHSTRQHEAALALLFLGPTATAPAWPSVPGAAERWGSHPSPLPSSPLCPGLGRGQGPGHGSC